MELVENRSASGDEDERKTRENRRTCDVSGGRVVDHAEDKRRGTNDQEALDMRSS